MRIPKYRLHKATGGAWIECGGRRTYLGRYGTEESKLRYRQKLREWANKRGIPVERFGLSERDREPPAAAAVLPPEPDGFVYFVRDANGFIKTGHSQSPLDRIRDIAANHALGLETVGVIRGSECLEKASWMTSVSRMNGSVPVSECASF